MNSNHFPRDAHVMSMLHQRSAAAIGNRCLPGVFKLAGAPKAHAAGIAFHPPIESCVEALNVDAESTDELASARVFAEAHRNLKSLPEF